MIKALILTVMEPERVALRYILPLNNGQKWMVKLLLVNSADINARNMAGNIALDLTPESASAVRTLLSWPSQTRQGQAFADPLLILKPISLFTLPPRSGDVLPTAEDSYLSANLGIHRLGSATFDCGNKFSEDRPYQNSWTGNRRGSKSSAYFDLLTDGITGTIIKMGIFRLG